MITDLGPSLESLALQAGDVELAGRYDTAVQRIDNRVDGVRDNCLVVL
jgi:hypothetical protein